MSGRLRAMLASLCPPQTPHNIVCSSNVEERGGDMGWEGKREESQGETCLWNLEPPLEWGEATTRLPREKPRDKAKNCWVGKDAGGGLLLPKAHLYFGGSMRLPATLPGSQLLAGKEERR